LIADGLEFDRLMKIKMEYVNHYRLILHQNRSNKKCCRGVALVLAMIAIMIAGIVAFSYIGAQSTSTQIASNIQNHSKALHVAEAGQELTMAYIRNNSNWRSQPNGIWVANHSYGEGAFTIIGEDGKDMNGDGVITIPDEGDGDLADDNSDPATITAIGKVNGVTHRTRVIVTENTGVTFETGTVSAGQDRTTVQLSNIYTRPVVVCTVNYDKNKDPVVTRVSNITSNSFDLRLQNPSGKSVTTENISYIVMEEGVWEIDGIKCEAQQYNSTLTDHSKSWIGEKQQYGQPYTNPVVFGQVMSENDSNWSVFWCRGNSTGTPPSATDLYTGKTVCEDKNTSRNNEVVGFIVFESGNGYAGGVPFECQLGIDTVRGIADEPPYTYIFNTPFNTVPSVLLANLGGIGEINGGWAVTYDKTPATVDQLNLAIDEDAFDERDRSHTTEQVGYLVFESPINMGSGNDVNFGYDTSFGEEEKDVNGCQIATQVSLNQDGILTSISAYVKGPSPKLLRYAVYADSNGEPGDLILETLPQLTTSNEFHWRTIYTTPTPLSAGSYWLALCLEHSNMYYKYDKNGGQTRFHTNDAITNGYSTPWGVSDDSNTRQVSIYATIRPDSGSHSGSELTFDWQN